jgi:hypothetical protein
MQNYYFQVKKFKEKMESELNDLQHTHSLLNVNDQDISDILGLEDNKKQALDHIEDSTRLNLLNLDFFSDRKDNQRTLSSKRNLLNKVVKYNRNVSLQHSKNERSVQNYNQDLLNLLTDFENRKENKVKILKKNGLSTDLSNEVLKYNRMGLPYNVFNNIRGPINNYHDDREESSLNRRKRLEKITRFSEF